jgi:sugar lactone lactonase YvrE
MLRFILLTTVICLLLPAPGRAAKVKVWHHTGAARFDKAKLRGVVTSSEGAVRLSRRLKPLAKLDAARVWDVVEDRDGNLFVATGDEGKIFKVSAEGKVTRAYTSEDSQILCLALAADGALYAGTGPGGQVVRIPPSGKAQVIAKNLGSYVWSLAVDARGETLFAGTGPKGKIYRLTPEGKAKVFYRTRQDHILCLGLGAKGMVYAGTDKGGLVYRIDAKGKGFVLYQAAQAEVRSLLVTEAGVYAGTSTPTRRRSGGASSSVESGVSTSSRTGFSGKGVAAKPARKTAKGTPAAVFSSSFDFTDTGRGGSGSSVSAPGPGENSLYRINPDGTVRELFREKAMFLSLLRKGNRLFAGTGMNGQLFEVDEQTREHTELARLDHGQIHRLLRRRDGSVVLAAGDPGKLYALEDTFAATGTVLSPVLDAKIISKWGSLRWKADTPRGTRVTVAVRSGNVAEPDETWSDWSAEQIDGRRATVDAPTARFLQYRVTLATDDPAASPSLRSLTVRYMTTNQAPEVGAVDVPDLDAVNLDNPKKIRIKWTATDPNDDDLTYSLYVRKEGWKNWILLAENLEKKEYEWDTTTTPSGMYQAKVVASDRKDNPEKDALTGERVSSAFPVAHAPPTVTVKVGGLEGDKVVIEATATASLVRLTAASFALNGKKWVNVFPTDGLFDSKTESFRFTTASLKPGTYVLVLKVRDAAGNAGSGDIVFTVHAKTARR